MFKEEIEIKAKVWIYSGKGAWHFVSIPTEIAINIDRIHKHEKRGWGSLPVIVQLGESTWKTSIFPDKKTNTYILPLKADIRKKEKINEGDEIDFTIQIEI
jgi:hypothetical protein